MCNPLNLSRLAELDEAIDATHEQPMLLFKHSLHCDRSVRAYQELIQLCRELAGVTVSVVTVQSARQLCDEVARRFGIEHHTPQVLLVVDGGVKWHARHFQVTAEAMRDALAAACNPPARAAHGRLGDSKAEKRLVSAAAAEEVRVPTGLPGTRA